MGTKYALQRMQKKCAPIIRVVAQTMETFVFCIDGRMVEWSFFVFYFVPNRPNAMLLEPIDLCCMFACTAISNYVLFFVVVFFGMAANIILLLRISMIKFPATFVVYGKCLLAFGHHMHTMPSIPFGEQRPFGASRNVNRISFYCVTVGQFLVHQLAVVVGVFS